MLDAATWTVNNNDFAYAEVFTGNGPINDFDFTVCSDTEPGEPGPFSLDNGIWWDWTPASTGTATISTEDSGSFVTTFDTTLAVYTGSTLPTLKLVAANDDSGHRTRRSLVRLPGQRRHHLPDQGRRVRRVQRAAQPAHRERPAAGLLQGTPATIVGTAGNDVINGTAGNDVIVAGAGNDTINGSGGDDTHLRRRRKRHHQRR